MKTPRIDAHHHLWKYSAEEYGWIDERSAAIRSDFLPDDLKDVLASSNVDGAVTVQARQTLEETRWLLELASKHDFLRAVVGWVPLTDPKVSGILEGYVTNPKLRGIRHVLQGEPDDRYMLREDFNDGIRALHHYGLVYDILIYERQLRPSIELVDRHPGQVFVLDHVAKPKIKDKVISPWRENIRDLAKRPNVFCKISGMATEADWSAWTEADLQPYIDTVLEAFTPRRLMFGSDWPVCLLATSYAHWYRLVEKMIAGLSEAERDRVLGGTAIEAYGLRD